MDKMENDLEKIFNGIIEYANYYLEKKKSLGIFSFVLKSNDELEIICPEFDESNTLEENTSLLDNYFKERLKNEGIKCIGTCVQMFIDTPKQNYKIEQLWIILESFERISYSINIPLAFDELKNYKMEERIIRKRKPKLFI